MALLSAFNPHEFSEATVRTIATGREEILAGVLEAIRGNLGPGPVQHLVVSAPRGYGKSFLMRHVQIEVERIAREEGLPLAVLLMPEEMPHVKEPETLIRELTRALTGGAAAEAELTWHEDDGAAWEAALDGLDAAIRARLGAQGLCVALVENFDHLLRRAFPKAVQASRLREGLARPDGRLMLIAASASGAIDRDYESRLFHAFRHVDLEPWTVEECMAFFDRQRRDAGRAPLDAPARARARAVATFIGGTPRLATLLGDALFDADVLRAADLLQRLVDELTPYYKERIEALPGRSQKLLDALLRGGEPATQSDLARRVKAHTQAAIAAPFADLVKERVVVGEKAPDSAEVLYRVADRVFAHYYRRRVIDHGRTACPLEALVDLLADFFSPDEKRAKAEEFARLGLMPEARLMARLHQAEMGGGRRSRGILRVLADYHIPRRLLMLASPTAAEQLRAIADLARAGQADEAGARTEAALQAATGAEDHVLMLLVRSRLDAAAGLDGGLAAAREAVEIAAEARNLRLQMRAELGLAWSLDETGQALDSIDQAHRVAARARQADDAREEAIALRLAAFSLGKLDRHEEAIAAAHEAAARARQAGDAGEEAIALRFAAFSLGQLDRHEEAIAAAHEAAARARQAGDAREEAIALRFAAFSLGQLDRHEEAIAAAHEAAACARQAGDAGEEAIALRFAAFSLGKLDRHEEAIAAAHEAAARARQAGDAREEAIALRFAAFSLGKLDRHEEAIAAAHEAAARARQAGDAREEAIALRFAAFSLGKLDRHEEAIAAAQEAAARARQAGDAREEAEALRHAAFSLGRLGRHEEAVATAHEAAARARQAGDAREEAEALRHAAFSLGKLDRHEEAVAAAHEAAARARQAGDAGEEAEALRHAAFSLGRLGLHKEAAETLFAAGRTLDAWPDDELQMLLEFSTTAIATSAATARSDAGADLDAVHALLRAVATDPDAAKPQQELLLAWIWSFTRGSVTAIEDPAVLTARAEAIALHFPGRFPAETDRLHAAAAYHASGRDPASLARLDPDLARTLRTMFPPAEAEPAPARGRRSARRRKP